MSDNREYVMEPVRRIPVYKRVGVLVCGSGSGAGRGNMRGQKRSGYLLIERQSFLGGESTAAYQNWFGGPTDILTGFSNE